MDCKIWYLCSFSLRLFSTVWIKIEVKFGFKDISYCNKQMRNIWWDQLNFTNKENLNKTRKVRFLVSFNDNSEVYPKCVYGVI